MEDDWYLLEQLHFAAQDGDLCRVQDLVASGYDVNAFDGGLRYTPLHYAVKGEFFAVTRYLIGCGADVNAHDETRIGETPLGAASPQCSFEMAELLIKSGANPSIPGWMGITAIHRAKDRQDDEGQRVFDLLMKAAGRQPQEKNTREVLHPASDAGRQLDCSVVLLKRGSDDRELRAQTTRIESPHCYRQTW